MSSFLQEGEVGRKFCSPPSRLHWSQLDLTCPTTKLHLSMLQGKLETPRSFTCVTQQAQLRSPPDAERIALTVKARTNEDHLSGSCSCANPSAQERQLSRCVQKALHACTHANSQAGMFHMENLQACKHVLQLEMARNNASMLLVLTGTQARKQFPLGIAVPYRRRAFRMNAARLLCCLLTAVLSLCSSL